ncbi:MAG TPA: rhodanese-like domain-containing protein [candidate division Zixibacteria bacterium]|nr:rhodanese-like domain-containing protein [candidate division Zixibacteria bacterium]
MAETLLISQYVEQPENYQLVDVRSASEFAAGHIPGAVNIPLEQLELRIADLIPTRTIVLTCQGGQRARIAAGLVAPSRPGVLILEGSTSGWAASGRPLVKSVASRWALERQVRLVAGLLVVLSVVLSLSLSRGWIFLAAFVGCGLTFAGLTNICGMGILLAKMPWNKASSTRSTTAQNCCSQ